MKLQLQMVMKPLANYTEQRHHLHFTLDIDTITQIGMTGTHECYCLHAVCIEKDTTFDNFVMSNVGHMSILHLGENLKSSVSHFT